MKKINRNGGPLTATRRGKSLATITPASPSERTLGGQKKETKVNGDIVHFDFSDEWECNL